MEKRASILFLAIFFAFMGTPTVVAMAGGEVDMTAVVVNEEEEKNGEERNPSENKFQSLDKMFPFITSLETFSTSLSFIHYCRNFPTIYFDLPSPPPEQA